MGGARARPRRPRSAPGSCAPGSASTPLDTSTPNGRTVAMAAATLSTRRPPARISCGVSGQAVAASRQSLLTPWPLTGPSNRKRRGGDSSSRRTTAQYRQDRQLPRHAQHTQVVDIGLPAVGLELADDFIQQLPAADGASPRCTAPGRARSRRAARPAPAESCRGEGENTNPMASTPACSAAAHGCRIGEAADLDPKLRCAGRHIRSTAGARGVRRRSSRGRALCGSAPLISALPTRAMS